MKKYFTIKLFALLFFLLFTGLLSACGTVTPPATPNATTTVGISVLETAESGPTAASKLPSIQDAANAVAARTPVPTPTPGFVDREIAQVTDRLGLTGGRTFLGLTVDDWINLGISGLIVLVGYLIGFRLTLHFLKWIAARTNNRLDEKFLNMIERDLKLLVVVFVTRYAINRLDFLSDGMRTTINDLFYIFIICILTIIALNSINFAIRKYQAELESTDNKLKLEPFMVTFQRIAQFSVLVIAISMLLSYFGFNINVLTAVLVIGAVIISFGAKDIFTDALSGFIILLDQPFRIGDDILIKELNTHGNVTEIGTRTTHIRTHDNRVVIVPNSQMSQSLLVNYTYPDSEYRLQTDIGVAYGTDFHKMRQVIKETVRGVEGVLKDKFVDILFLEFGDSARLIRVRWWIENFKNHRTMQDRVNTALEIALYKAGINLPFDTFNLQVEMQGENPSRADQSE